MLEFSASVENLNRFTRQLRGFDLKKQQRVLKSSLNSSTGPIKTQLRRQIRSNAIRFGHMLKAVKSKVKVYKNTGTALLLVGIQDKRLGDGENPGKYFHLVDQGTRPHHQPDGAVPINGRLVKIPGGRNHPGVRPRNMLAKAQRLGQKKVSQQFARSFERKLKRCFS